MFAKSYLFVIRQGFDGTTMVVRLDQEKRKKGRQVIGETPRQISCEDLKVKSAELKKKDARWRIMNDILKTGSRENLKEAFRGVPKVTPITSTPKSSHTHLLHSGNKCTGNAKHSPGQLRTQ